MNLSIDIAGIQFQHPFLLASAPPTRNAEMIMRAFEAGWAGAVTKTITKSGTRSPAPRLISTTGIYRNTFLENIELLSEADSDEWRRWLEEITNNYDNPVIASIMAPADKPDEWAELAQMTIQSGAKAVELNISCPHGMPERAAGAYIGQDPTITAEIVSAVRESISAPVWVKLTPNVTDIALIGRSAIQAGADCLAAINTLSGIAGVNIETMTPLPAVNGRTAFGGISGPAIKPAALRCTAQLAKLGKPISGIGGINDWKDAVEFFLLGASTVQLCTAIMFKGFDIIRDLIAGLTEYLSGKGFKSFEEIISLALPKIAEFDELNLSNRPHFKINKECDLCGDCIIACRDAGLNAIRIENSRAVIDQDKCDRCGLCKVVCPIGAVEQIENNSA